MALPQIYEGTAEEIVEQLRASKLTGKLKAIVTPDEYEVSLLNETEETLDIALAPLLEEASRIARENPVPHTDPYEKAFGEIIETKYRKLGFTL